MRPHIVFLITLMLGLLVTFAFDLLVAPLAPEAQPPTHVHRIDVLAGGTRE